MENQLLYIYKFEGNFIHGLDSKLTFYKALASTPLHFQG